MTMIKMMLAAAFAALMLTLAAPEMTHALQMEQAESATLAQLTRDTTPAALQAPDSGSRLSALARKLLALVDGGSTTAPQHTTQAPRWVPVDQYVNAVAQVPALPPRAAP